MRHIPSGSNTQVLFPSTLSNFNPIGEIAFQVSSFIRFVMIICTDTLQRIPSTNGYTLKVMS